MAFNYRTQIERYRKYYQSLEPMLKTSSSRAYTSIVFSFLAVSLFAWYAIRPTIQTILSLRREISDKTTLNKQMEDKITALIEAQAAYQEVESQLPAVLGGLPDNPDALLLARQLRLAAEEVGVTMTSIQIPSVPLASSDATPSAETGISQKLGITPAKKQSDVILNLTLEGPFPALKAYMTAITQMRRIVSIDGFSVSVSKQPTATDEVGASESADLTSRTIQLALKVKAYYLAR